MNQGLTNNLRCLRLRGFTETESWTRALPFAAYGGKNFVNVVIPKLSWSNVEAQALTPPRPLERTYKEYVAA